MMERLEVAVGVFAVALTLTFSATVGISGGAMANGVLASIPFLGSESSEASEAGPAGPADFMRRKSNIG